jgi:Sigma-70, region 4
MRSWMRKLGHAVFVVIALVVLFGFGDPPPERANCFYLLRQMYPAEGDSSYAADQREAIANLIASGTYSSSDECSADELRQKLWSYRKKVVHPRRPPDAAGACDFYESDYASDEERREQGAKLDALIGCYCGHMHSRNRCLVLAYRVAGHTHQEIAALLRISEANSKQLACRAKSQLDRLRASTKQQLCADLE